MVPATSLISLFLFGIEELATQLEEPFTILPMQGFCDKIGANCDEIVSWAGLDMIEKQEVFVAKGEEGLELPEDKMTKMNISLLSGSTDAAGTDDKVVVTKGRKRKFLKKLLRMS
jgi:hypothetical protein